MVLVVDVSGSSTFGSVRRSKREFAAEIAGTLAISATRSSDKVALLLFTDRVEFFLPPRKGRRHILRLIREMLSFEPKHRGTNIPAALAFLNHVLHRRAIVFLLTDFLHSFGQPRGQKPKDTPPASDPGAARGRSPESEVQSLKSEGAGPRRVLDSVPAPPRDALQEMGL